MSNNPHVDPKDEYQRLKDFYYIFREQIQHEDELIHQRITWVTNTQGFLFLAYSALAGLQNGLGVHQKQIICTGVSALGLFLCFTAFWGIFSAIQSLNRIHEHFDEIFKAPNEKESKWLKIFNRFFSIFGLRWDKHKHRLTPISVVNKDRKNKMNFPPVSGAGAFDLNQLLGANTMIETIPVACAVVWGFLIMVALSL